MNDLAFLYDQTLEHIARLYGFVSARIDDWDGIGDTEEDVQKVAELLVRRDLLTFAATLRNFAKSASLVDGMKKVQVFDAEIYLKDGPPCFREKGSGVNLYRCLSRILHSYSIEIFRHPGSFILETSQNDDVGENYIEIVTFNKKYDVGEHQVFEPLLVISTEDDGKYYVSLRRLLKMSAFFLDAACKVLESRESFLRRSIRDI